MVLAHSGEYSLIQRLSKVTEKYVIAYKLKLTTEIEWAYGMY